MGDRPLVRDLLTLTRALLHQGDREAWLALLRGPWCGLSLQALLHLVEGEAERTLWSLMRDESVLVRLKAGDRQRVEQICRILQQSFRQRGLCSLARWIEQTWIQLGGAVLYHQQGEPGQSAREQQAFFTLLAEMEQGGEVVDLQRLQQRLQQQNLRAAEGGEANVRVEVMTIHKSKGLQFDTVILPGLGRKPRVADSRLLQWLEVPQAGDHSTMQLLLAPVRAAVQRLEEDRLGRYVRQLEQEREWNELSRLLYVAITRAERKVHLLGATRINVKGELSRPPARSLLEQLWPQLEPKYQQRLAQSDVEQLQQRQQQEVQYPQSKPQRLQSICKLPQPPQPVVPLYPLPEPQGVYRWGSSSAVHIGTVVHAMLQWIAQQGVVQWVDRDLQPLQSRIVQQLRQLGVVEAERERAVAQVMAALQGVLSDPQGRYFLADHAEARSEWSLSALLEGELVHVTIDRTFVDEDGVRWIVDWKSSHHEGGGLEQFLDEEVIRYTPQLQKYGALLRQMEERPQRLVLYFPMHRQMREVVSG